MYTKVTQNNRYGHHACLKENEHLFRSRAKARAKRRTSHDPNRMLMRENKGFSICIRFGSCEVQSLTPALAFLKFLSLHTCTRSFALANDAEIVLSRDAQYNTEESP